MQPCSRDREKLSHSLHLEPTPPLPRQAAEPEPETPFVETAIKSARSKKSHRRNVNRSALPTASSQSNGLDASTVSAVASRKGQTTKTAASHNPALSLESLGVSAKAIEKLQYIWNNSLLATELGLFEGVVFHLFTCMEQLQKQMDENLKIESLSRSLKIVVPTFHFNLYELLVDLHLQIVSDNENVKQLMLERSIFREIPPLLSNLICQVEEIDQAFSEARTKHILLQRLSAIRQKERLATNLLAPIRTLFDEMQATLSILRELTMMPSGSIQTLCLSSPTALKEFMVCSKKPKEAFQNELKAYAQCIASVVEEARRRGFTSVLTVNQNLYRILVNDAANLATLSLKDAHNTYRQLKETEEAILELLKLQDQVGLFYMNALSGQLTHRQFMEQNQATIIREKNQTEFSAMLLNGFLCWNVMIDNYASIYNCATTQISNSYSLIIEGQVLAKMACCWHHVTSAREENDRRLLELVIQICNEKLHAHIGQTSLVTLIEHQLDAVLSIHGQLRESLTKEVLEELEKFFDTENLMNWQGLYKIRMALEPFAGALRNFHSKSLLFNKTLASEYNKLVLQEAISPKEASFLNDLLQQLKCDVSLLLAPSFELVESYLKATEWKEPQKRQCKKLDRHLELSLDSHEIPWIFDVPLKMPKETAQPVASDMETASKETGSSDIASLERNLGEEANQTSPPRAAKPNLKPEAAPSSAPKTTSTSSQTEDNLPTSVKLKDLMKFLTDKGWKVISINGSHLKLKLRGESLIVPVNNRELKRGTMHGILKQEEEKEKRLIEKK
ncbi:type II toxin-antitoxin system HicA family toxin [Estrella lausannensis]|uniref:Uncharacterized protein n=1 Tax=Estrella lausannensis TaxID=483423 RepID=A0A0H5DRX8_9BACT|nr:type II toxin-antitoxin system HicA family toxin [Estrella lausannensis]CRX39387.1 hypothetical protein ELAC_2066 [Estrella lausannensis]